MIQSYAFLLALPLAPAVRHFHAQAVDPSQKLLRGFHPYFQPFSADQRKGLHQRPGPVPQQHPIHGKMDVGFLTGRIQKILLQVHRLFQVQYFGLLDPHLEQLIDQRAH